MKILIDADGCPVVDLTIQTARQYAAKHSLAPIEVLILCDNSHVFNKEGAETITVDKGADSADFALANRAQPGDIVVTQDYGLAALCLARGGIPLNQDGMAYTQQNIDALLFSRYASKKDRAAGIRSGARLKKRTQAQNNAFAQALQQLLAQQLPI